MVVWVRPSIADDCSVELTLPERAIPPTPTLSQQSHRDPHTRSPTLSPVSSVMLSQVARLSRRSRSLPRLGTCQPSASLLPSLARSNATSSTPTPPPSQSWTDTLKNALPSFGSSTPSQAPLKHAIPDPLRLVKKELNLLRGNVSQLLGSGHPSLDTVAKYYFTAEGKHLRPTIVLLMAQATNGLGSHWPEAETKHDANMNKIVAGRPDVINDFNPGMPEDTSADRKSVV